MIYSEVIKKHFHANSVKNSFVMKFQIPVQENIRKCTSFRCWLQCLVKFPPCEFRTIWRRPVHLWMLFHLVVIFVLYISFYSFYKGLHRSHWSECAHIDPFCSVFLISSYPLIFKRLSTRKPGKTMQKMPQARSQNWLIFCE